MSIGYADIIMYFLHPCNPLLLELKFNTRTRANMRFEKKFLVPALFHKRPYPSNIKIKVAQIPHPFSGIVQCWKYDMT